MQKLVFTIMLTLGFFALSQAQVMNCNGSPTGAKVTFVNQDLNTVTLLVDWDEGSTFSSSSLALTNATCSSCPFVGGIGRPHGVQKTYVLNKIDNTQPVEVDWGPIGTSAYCGSQSLTIQPNLPIMNCNGSPTGAKVTFINQNATTVTLRVDWDEGSTFSSSSLALTNATCSSCPFVGGIGRPHGVQKTYVLNKIDDTQDVIINWGPIGTSAYCGTESITVPTLNPPAGPTIGTLGDITVPGCDGLIVTYDYSSAVTSPSPANISYNPASGSAFNVGSTQVTMTATNSGGSATATFNVIVEDNVDPTVVLLGDNPMMICQGEQFIDPLAYPDDNCGLSDFQPSGNVDVNTPGTYTRTYTVTDVGGNTASVARSVIVKPLPAALEQDNCPSGNPTCDRIDLRICPYGEAPDLAATAMGNAAYVSGAPLNWYLFTGANNPPGPQLSGPPAVDMESPASNTNAWITQTVDGCESPATRMRVRVKPDKDPGLTLDLSGITLPTCGGATIDFLSAVSGYSNKVSGFRFYEGKPNQGGTLLTSTSGTTVANVGDPYFYAPVSNGTNDYYVQSIMSNANQCGGEASDEVSLSVANPEIISIGVTINGVNLGTFTSFPVTVPIQKFQTYSFEYTLSNTSALFLYVPNIASVILSPNGNTLVYTSTYTLSSSVAFGGIPYNRNCSGSAKLINFNCTNCRSAQEGSSDLSSLLLSASSINKNDVALNWEVNLSANNFFSFNSSFERVEIQKEVALGQYETISTQPYAGEGKYRYTDLNGIDEVNKYRVMLVTADGDAMVSNEAEVKAYGFIDPNAFSIFPNPTTDRVQIQALFPVEESLTWQLTDMVGKTVMSGMMQEAEMSLDVSRLPNGVYQFVTISREGARSVNRIVKQ